MAFTLPELNYDYDALDRAIDARTMEIHHTKHHNTYVTKLNDALAGTAHEGAELESLLKEVSGLPAAVRNNGGGHYNHSLFWNMLSPNGGGAPTGAVASAIDSAFGSYAAFQEQFTAAALGRFGSGWAWLIATAEGVKVTSTPNRIIQSWMWQNTAVFRFWGLMSGSMPTICATKIGGRIMWRHSGTSLTGTRSTACWRRRAKPFRRGSASWRCRPTADFCASARDPLYQND